MGTTQSSIARIESGGSLPTIDMLARLAHATGTPLRIAFPGITDVDLGGATTLFCSPVRGVTCGNMEVTWWRRYGCMAGGQGVAGSNPAVPTRNRR